MSESLPVGSHVFVMGRLWGPGKVIGSRRNCNADEAASPRIYTVWLGPADDGAMLGTEEFRSADVTTDQELFERRRREAQHHKWGLHLLNWQAVPDFLGALGRLIWAVFKALLGGDC